MKLLQLYNVISEANESALSEVYSSEIGYLKRFLSGDTHEIDGYYLWSSQNSPIDPSMADWLADHYPQMIKPWMEKEGVDDPNDLDQEYSQHVPAEPYMEYAREVGEDYVEYMMQHDPASAPSTAFYSSPTLIKRSTWLVHFTNAAEAVASKGFIYGIDNMDQLGLTTYFNKSAKQYGGYNFAFVADERYAINAARGKKYGEDAVVFMNAGIEAYHNGDDEEQVIFYGEHVDPRNLIVITRSDDGWCVNPHPSKWKTSGRECYYTGEDYIDAINWIEQNWRQYSKVITGW